MLEPLKKAISTLLPILLGLFGGQQLSAQIVISQLYDQIPLSLNPAFAGSNQDIRAGATYRYQMLGQPLTQPNSFKGIQNATAYFDAPIVSFQKKEDGAKHFLGLGGHFDYSGSGMNYLNLNLDLAFHLSLSKKNNTYIGIGVEAGYEHLLRYENSLFLEDTVLDLSFSGNGYQVSPGLLFSHKGTGWGLQFSSSLKALINRTDYTIGGYSHRPAATVNMLRGDIKISTRSRLQPLFLFQHAGRETYMNAQVLYILALGKIEQQHSLILGLGKRIGANFQFRAGYAYKGWTVTASYEYDADFFKAHGFELGLTYAKPLADKG